MILGSAALLFLALIGGGQTERPAVRGTQVTVQQQVIIRVTPAPQRQRVPGLTVTWTEHSGPRCVSARQIVGATLLNQNSVDLILRDNRRVRAHLQRSCPALDYYYGFYLNGTPDGRICARRDPVRSRMGGACQIDRFKLLRPVVQRERR